jgi:hypothetical protein
MGAAKSLILTPKKRQKTNPLAFSEKTLGAADF